MYMELMDGLLTVMVKLVKILRLRGIIFTDLHIIGEVYIRGILELAGLNVDAPGVENGIDDAGLDLVIYNKQGD